MGEIDAAAVRERPQAERSNGRQNGSGGADEVGGHRSTAAKGERKRRASGKGSSGQGRRNRELGRRGEDAAARFLDRRGYDIIERNWTCAAGEADIIARDGDALVFVEVKTRSSTDKGLPSEAVDAAKRGRYERIAALFLQSYDVVDVPVRFDVVSLVLVSPDRALVRHHIDAFTAE